MKAVSAINHQGGWLTAEVPEERQASLEKYIGTNGRDYFLLVKQINFIVGLHFS